MGNCNEPRKLPYKPQVDVKTITKPAPAIELGKLIELIPRDFYRHEFECRLVGKSVNLTCHIENMGSKSRLSLSTNKTDGLVESTFEINPYAEVKLLTCVLDDRRVIVLYLTQVNVMETGHIQAQVMLSINQSLFTNYQFVSKTLTVKPHTK